METGMEQPRVTAVLLIAHGSRKVEANQELHDLAGRIRSEGVYPIVEPSFLELAEPDIRTGGSSCVSRGATRVLMIPYFLSAGVHLQDDLKTARDELRDQFPEVDFRLAAALGPHPFLDGIVAERIRELDHVDGERTGLGSRT